MTLERLQRSISFLLAWVVMVGCGVATAQLLPAHDMNQDDEGMAGARILIKIMKQAPDSEIWCQLGDLFLQENRPYQARYCYQQASQIQPESEAAVAGIKAVEKELDHLEKRFAEYQTEAETGTDVRDYCSMAAIRFHQGFTRESLEILQQASKRYPKNREIQGLTGTFLYGINHETEKLAKYHGEMNLALVRKEPDRALENLGRMIYLSLGRPAVTDLLNDLRAFYPEFVQVDSIERIQGMSVTTQKAASKPEVKP